MGLIRGCFISNHGVFDVLLRSQPQVRSNLCRWLQIPTSSPDLTKKKKLIPEQAPTRKQVDFSSKNLRSLAVIPVLHPRNEAIIRLLDNHHKYWPVSIGNKSRVLQTRPMSGGNTISILQTSAVKAKPPHCSDGDVANVTELARIQEKYHKLFPPQIQENFGMFWKLYCCPWNQEIWNHEDPKQLDDLFFELGPLLESAIPEYPDVIKELVSGSAAPEQGKYFDVASFLSSCGGRVLVRNNGDQVSLSADHFRGKYILICCFLVPPGFESLQQLRSFIDLCNELYSTRDDFEMVMVARMNSLANDKVVFDSFFSGFPESCLAVPFEDSKQRDYICGLLDMCRCGCEFLFLNKKGIVLPFLDWDDRESFGAEAFPFTHDVMDTIKEKRMEMRVLKSSLEEMLQSNESSSPAIVYKLNPAGGPREEMPISDLNNKHVGLYLCMDGVLIPDLLSVYEQCRKNKLDIEIVVVNVPTKLYQNQKRMEGLLQKHNICDWWCLPFNNSVSRRLFSLIDMNTFKNYDLWDDVGKYYDKLTVVGPLVKGDLDSYCADVLQFHGVDAYPFTIEASIEMIMNKVRKFTLQSLMTGTLFRGNNRNDITSVKDLRGRKILLYIGTLCRNEDSSSLNSAVSLYHKIKAKKAKAPGFEMVYVEVGEDDVGSQIQVQSKMPWYVCPSNGTNFTSLEALLGLFDFGRQGLIGFDEDGRVCLLETTSEVVNYDENFQDFPLDDDDALYNSVESRFGYDFCLNINSKMYV